LTGCAAWLLLATVAKLPVSTSHSIVGAMVGITIAIAGVRGIRWMKMVEIGRVENIFLHKITHNFQVISWFVSPLMSGAMSCVIYGVIKYTVLNKVRVHAHLQ
jgi:sodium-dependent phosphate transporter